jgi:lipooligosaccharide transport system permease protein
VLPVTLFSGTVFPLDQLPWFLQWLGWISPLWHGTELARLASYGSEQPLWLTFVHLTYLVVLAIVGWRLACRHAIKRLGR